VEDEDEDRESEIGLEQINCCRDSHFEWMLWMLKYEMKDMMSRVVILAVPCSCCSFTFFCVFFCTALMIFFRVRVRPSAPPHPDSHVTRILPTWQCTHTYYTPAQPILFTFCATNWTTLFEIWRLPMIASRGAGFISFFCRDYGIRGLLIFEITAVK
jgi:hypothetical protein